MDGHTLDHVQTLFRWFKEGPPGAIPLLPDTGTDGCLQAITWEDAGDPEALDRLCAWHCTAFAWMPDFVPVTHTSVRRWLVEQVLECPRRVLFWIKDNQDRYIGHVGLSGLDQARMFRLSDLLCGHPSDRVWLDRASHTLVQWCRESLEVHLITAPATAAA